MAEPDASFYYVRCAPGSGLARPVDRTREQDMPIIRHVMYGGEIEQWPARVYDVDGPLADRQPELRGLRLCSDRLRTLLQEERSEADTVQWLPVEIRDGEASHPYWVLHFPEFPDVVDRDLSTFQTMDGEEFVNRAVLDLEKAKPHRVMASPQRFPTAFMVAGDVRRRLDEAGMTGLDFEAAARSLI